MKYVRDTYGVPAKRGGRVEYTDNQGMKFKGTIKSARNGRLEILIDGLRYTGSYHPTWQLVYLEPPK